MALISDNKKSLFLIALTHCVIQWNKEHCTATTTSIQDPNPCQSHGRRASRFDQENGKGLTRYARKDVSNDGHDGQSN